ncbi:hypothetical protein G4G28_10265 [Massilia sp. Dwa41.01b]|nr:hypothetical protein [Massilia sp. Se16.2.3]QNA88785.1 hypothetical protein G4G28_10265 [Massilia sp. Dwa41.01b]QNA99685.1 hypothetical protein G4G31_13950 [Massilia sp. Se16.2.3]
MPAAPHVAAHALRRARKLLFARLHGLFQQPEAAFVRGFAGVVAIIEAELAHEEAVIEMLGLDCLQARRADNAFLLGALHAIETRVEAGDAELGRTAMAACADLLSLHRLTTDLAVAQARPLPGRASRMRTSGRQHRPR